MAQSSSLPVSHSQILNSADYVKTNTLHLVTKGFDCTQLNLLFFIDHLY